MNLRYLFFLTFLLFFKSHYGQNQSPSLPFIEQNICPGEGCQFGSWTVKSPMKAFISEGDSNKIAFLIKQNEKITAIRGNVHIMQFGLVKITKKDDSFVKNDTAYILSYLGEGYYDAWYKGGIIQFQDCDPSFTNCNPSFTTLKSAKTEWWVYIKNGSGKFGWLRILDHDLSNIDGRNIY